MRRGRVRIHISFYVALIYFVISGGWSRFLTMAALVFAHETGHLLAALLLGLKAEKIVITPIGQRLTVRDFYSEPRYKRIAVLISGPVISLVLAVTGHFTGIGGDIADISMLLFIINLLPVMPLDGGGIAMALLGGIRGDIRAAKLVLAYSKIFSQFIIIFGFIWAVLYPYNVDFVVAGLFIRMINKASSPSVYSGILKPLLKPGDRSILKVHYIFAGNNTLQKDVISRMKTDRRNVAVFMTKGGLTFVDQSKICKRTMRDF